MTVALIFRTKTRNTILIHFYRKMHSFNAITLDLDNTLYDNKPVISNAEKRSFSFLKTYHPALNTMQKKDYIFARSIIKSTDPEIYHNVNSWRWKSLEKTLLLCGLSKYDAQLGADCAMDVVIFWRNKINIPDQMCKVLSILRSRWPLIAITNGNSDPVVYGLKKYFSDVLWAGVNGRAKPYTDMYFLASKYFDLPCKYILHVGDDLGTDIQGAIRSGMQACWINKFNSYHHALNYTVIDKSLFPHLKISELIYLTYFL